MSNVYRHTSLFVSGFLCDEGVVNSVGDFSLNATPNLVSFTRLPGEWSAKQLSERPCRSKSYFAYLMRKLDSSESSNKVKLFAIKHDIHVEVERCPPLKCPSSCHADVCSR